MTSKGPSSLEILQLQFALHVSLTGNWDSRQAHSGERQPQGGDKRQAMLGAGHRGHAQGRRNPGTQITLEQGDASGTLGTETHHPVQGL